MILGSGDLAADLAKLGVNKGDGLFVHSSLKQIGHVIGGPRGLIEAMIATVGASGLIGMPGFSGDAHDPAAKAGPDMSQDDITRLRSQVPGFDCKRSNVLQNGAVAEAFRCWPGTVRSLHPTSSVLLFGKDAANLSKPHEIKGWATGPETPWGKLRNRPNMKILLIGVGWNRCSALHAAETAAIHKRTTSRHIKIGSGSDTQWIYAPDVANDLDTLFPLVGSAWEAEGQVSFGKIGNAECRLTSYDELVSFASDWINQRNQQDGVPAS